MEFFTETIKNRIAGRQYLPGSLIPSERKFAEEFNLSISKVHRMLQGMVAEGYLKSRRGHGYSVNPTPKINSQKIIRLAFIINEISLDSKLPLPNIASGLFIYKAANANILLDTLEMRYEWENFDEKLDSLINNKDFDAIVIHGSEKVHWNNAFSKAVLLNYPLIFRDYSPFDDIFPSVGCNNFELGMLAAKHLSEKKYRRPLYIGYPGELSIPAKMRLDGFRTACRFYDMEEPELLLQRPDERPLFSAEFSKRLKNRQFDSIFASTGSFTEHLVAFMLQNSIKPKSEFAIIGTDTPISIFGQEFKVSCVMQDREGEADELIRLIKDKIHGGWATNNVTIRIKPAFIAGDTL